MPNDKWATTRGFVQARKSLSRPPPRKEGTPVPLENQHIIPFAKPKCKACFGRGVVVSAPADAPTQFAERLCGCAIQRVMRIPGVELDGPGGRLCLWTTLEGDAAAGLEKQNAFDVEVARLRAEQEGPSVQKIEVPEV